MNPETIPVIRLELQYMKHAILHAFTQYSINLDADVRAAVESYCTPENIKGIVEAAVETSLKEAINREIEKFYLYGAGRDYIKQMVSEKLEKALK